MKVTYLSVIAKDGQTAAQRYAAMTKAQGTFYIVESDLYFEDKKITNASDLASAVGDISDIQATLTKLEGEENVSGSIRNIIRSYLTAAEVAVVDEAGNFTGTNVETVLAEIATSISAASSKLAPFCIAGCISCCSFCMFSISLDVSVTNTSISS